MSDPSDLSSQVLACLDVAVLRRVGPRKYVLHGVAPGFYERLFPGEGGKPCAEPWRLSRVLHFFLDDAEEFFTSGQQGPMSADIWSEEGLLEGNTALTAMAAKLGQEQVIIVRLLDKAVIDRDYLARSGRTTRPGEQQGDQPGVVLYRADRFDGLTSLLNRASFTELLSEEAQRATRVGGNLSLLLLDIDDFAGINAVFGQESGDRVLADIGALLRQLLRREDVPARIGGEEFAVFAPYTMQHQAERMAEKLRSAISEHAFGSLPPVTVSIGVATCRQGESADSLFARAGEALAEAKSGGKNLVHLK